jgi:hypothetical protein
VLSVASADVPLLDDHVHERQGADPERLHVLDRRPDDDAAQCAERAERMTSPGVGSTDAVRSETGRPCVRDVFTGEGGREIDGYGAREGGRVHELAAIK